MLLHKKHKAYVVFTALFFLLDSSCPYVFAQEQTAAPAPIPAQAQTLLPAINNLSPADIERLKALLQKNAKNQASSSNTISSTSMPPVNTTGSAITSPPLVTPPLLPLATPLQKTNSVTAASTEQQPVKESSEKETAAPLIAPLTYEQSQEQMLKLVPKTEVPTSPESAAAFDAMAQQNMPLTPQQVVKLRQLIDASQRAAKISPTIPPKPVSTTIMLNLAPGVTPPAIRLAQGYVTSLVFVDSVGSPWPVASYILGDPRAANIQWDGKSNVVVIQAITPYGDSDLVVRLAGLNTPITLALVSGQRVVDYRTDIHVSGLGPNTKDLPMGTPLPESANQLLLTVLDGIAPPGSKQLSVRGADCQAWLLGDKMYLRTRFTVLSPGWVGRMVSPDGMYAYEIQKSSSVLISRYGEPVELKVEGF